MRLLLPRPMLCRVLLRLRTALGFAAAAGGAGKPFMPPAIVAMCGADAGVEGS